MAAAEPPPSLPPAVRVVLADGSETHVRDTGAGDDRPALVLLHGLTASATLNWFRCFEALAGEHRVVSIDLPGHGRGPRARWRMRLDDAADHVDEVLGAIGVERAILVGFSMGGAVAQLVWRRHPGRVGGLVLVSTSARFLLAPVGTRLYAVTPLLARAVRLLPARAREAIVARVVRAETPELRGWLAAEAALNSPVGVVRCAKALRRFRSIGWLAELDVPVTVVISTADRSLSPRSQRALATAIPGAAVVEVAVGHSGIVWEHAVAVPALVGACASTVALAT